MEAERDKRKVRKFLYFERYSPVILRILMYGEVDKIKLGKTLFPNWRHILSQNKAYIKCKKKRYRARYHSVFMYSISVGTYVHG